MSFGDLIIVFGVGDAVRELSRRSARREPALVADDLLVRGAESDDERRPGLGHRAEGAACVGHPVLGEPGRLTVPVTIDLDREAEAVRSYTELVASQSR